MAAGSRIGPAPPRVAVSLIDGQWRRAVRAPVRRARAAGRATLLRAGASGACCSVALADDARVQALNLTFRGRDKPTNVLSFAAGLVPIPERSRFLGDVILARQTIVTEARDQGKSVADHLTHLVVHGVLHLLGHDHEDAQAAREMEGLEVEILAALGVPDPYRGEGQGG